MKPISRFLSFMLAVLTLFTALPALALPAAAEDYPTLLPGDAINITDETEFQFTPTESGTYRFYSTDNNGDPRGYLYDAGHKLITYDDDGNGNRNFKIEYDLTAGETYYLSASFWNGGSGSYTVCLEFIGIAGDGWSLVDGVLTISADFVMDDYSLGGAPWYSYRNDIVSVVLEDGVTTIGEYAFYFCTSLTSVTIPNSVTSIGEAAFKLCLSLTSVTIPGSVTTIGDYAFDSCASLTSVTIPSSVTTIGDFAFAYCSSLTSVTIPDSVTSIGVDAFRGCSSLTSVTIPDSVTSIGVDAFRGCSSLTSVTIPDSVTYLDRNAFYDCSSLTDIYCEAPSQPSGWRADWKSGCSATVHWGEIPVSAGECGENLTYTLNSNGTLQIDGTGAMTNWSASSSTPWYSNRDKIKTVVIGSGVTSIGDYAFASCTSLTSVTIPNSVTSIGEYAFDYCTSLTSVTIPNSVTRIYWYAFYDCSSLTDIFCEATEQPAGWFVAWLAGCDATVHWGEKPVTAGECGTNLTYTLYSNGRLQIDGTGAMTNWSSSSPSPWYSNRGKIKTVVIGSGVTSIGEHAFAYCRSLTSVTIGNSVKSIGDFAFDSCTSLTSVTIPNSVTSIGEYAFTDCESLTSVTLGNSVTGIGDYAFYYCPSLTAITVAEGNPSYCSIDGILYSADKTELICCPEGKAGSVTIPDSVTGIGERAFYCCTSLTSVTIPDSVTGIGDYAFRSCSSLTSVTIPDSVTTTIGEHAFAYCRSLTSVTIGNSVTGIGYGAFDSCSALTSVTIPDSVTYLDWYAFDSCSALTSVTIGNSVTGIGYGAFYNCSALTSVTIPDSVTYLDRNAFYDCSSLTDIYCEAESQPAGWNGSWLDGCDATVHWGSTGPDEPELVTGDLNEDGALSILDVTKLLIWIKEASVTPERLTMGDLNEDGTLSILDVTSLLLMLSEQ